MPAHPTNINCSLTQSISRANSPTPHRGCGASSRPAAPPPTAARIFAHRARPRRSGIVSVTTSSSSADFAMRSTAAPDSTGVRDVRHHRCAPSSFERLRRLTQRAGGVDHVVDEHAGLAATSPMMFITFDSFGARPALVDDRQSASSRRLASARARTTPPTSGETTIRFVVRLLPDVAQQHRRAHTRCRPGFRRIPGSGRRADRPSAPDRTPALADHVRPPAWP